MDLFGEIRNTLVFLLTLGQLSAEPVVVCTSGYMKNIAARLYWISVLIMAVSDGYIQIALSYL